MQKQNMSKLQCPWLSSIPRYLAVFYYRASKKKSKTEKNDWDKYVSLPHTVYGLRMEQEETINLNINVNKVDESLKTSPLLLNTSIINYG